jgi:ParB-like chromosome segregation protein Spo0J
MSWIENQNLVLATLQAHGATIERIAERLGKIEVEFANLKVKAGVFGA